MRTDSLLERPCEAVKDIYMLTQTTSCVLKTQTHIQSDPHKDINTHDKWHQCVDHHRRTDLLLERPCVAVKDVRTMRHTLSDQHKDINTHDMTYLIYEEKTDSI